MLLGDGLIADSDDVWLLHQPGRTPTYLFPRRCVCTELFAPSERRQSDPGMGERTYWSLRTGERRAADAAYSWESPPQEAAAIAGLIAFDWDSVTVFEEDEEVFVHPRDPYTRIDVLRSSRRVRVTVAGTVVADSTNPRMLLESGLPVRRYLPRGGVRTDLLEPSGTTTRCPYKRIAQYWSLRLPERCEEDLVWSFGELSPVTNLPGDGTGQALRQLYVEIAGSMHPDWDEYDRAMVDERRLVVTVPVTHGYGGGAG